AVIGWASVCVQVKLRRGAVIDTDHLVGVLVLGDKVPGQVDLEFVHPGEESGLFFMQRLFMFEDQLVLATLDFGGDFLFAPLGVQKLFLVGFAVSQFSFVIELLQSVL